MIETDLGCVTAYADAVAQGYTGTREEFGQVLANFADSATQVAADRTAVEAAKASVEEMQLDVAQKQETATSNMNTAVEAAEKAKQSASDAEASKQAAAQSEQNINNTVTAFDNHVEEKIAGFDSRVFEAVEQSEEEINTTKQQAIDTIINQQDASVNIVKTEGEKIITKVGNDAKTVADDRATVEEATQTVLNNAQEVAQNTQTVASNTEKAAASAEGAKTSADNAAKSAKSVEDASKQIEQNKKDVDSLKEDITSKADKTFLAQTDRKLDALWKLNQGISYKFEEDNTEAYRKTIPSGAKMANVKSIGGKTIVWNQLNLNSEKSATKDGISFINNKDGSWTITGTCSTSDGESANVLIYSFAKQFISGHKYLVKADKYFGENYGFAINGVSVPLKKAVIINYPFNPIIFAKDKVTVDNVTMRMNIFDLTQMFGVGNEPSTPEEFEAMFPADYYPYNAGELMSASVNEVIYLDAKSQETSYPIPQAILELDGYGENGNFVDFVEKKYHKGDRTIDISDIIGDTFQEPLEVEAGGTLTFKNSHGDDYRIPVPSSEEYVISLAEVAK